MVKKQKLQKENRGNTNTHINFRKMEFSKKFIARPSKYNEQHNLIDRFFFLFQLYYANWSGRIYIEKEFSTDPGKRRSPYTKSIVPGTGTT